MNNERLLYLLDRYSEQLLAEGEMRELEELLKNTPNAQTLFWEHSFISTLLRSACHLDSGDEIVNADTAGTVRDPAAPVTNNAAPLPMEISFPLTDDSSSLNDKTAFDCLNEPNSGMTISPFKFYGYMILSLLIGVLATASLFRNRDNASDFPIAKPNEIVKAHDNQVAAAQITSAVGCNWEGTKSSEWAVGNNISIGSEMNLQEGIAEFKLGSGVLLNVEGPATLVLTSVNSLFLQHGKITLHVPGDAPDFRVMAGACRFTARDSEFGVYTIGNVTGAHVFSGEVSASPAAYLDEEQLVDSTETDVLPFKPVFIEHGKAIEFTTGGQEEVALKNMVADNEKFAARVSASGRLPISPPYVDSIMKAKPFGYWRFEKIEDDHVRNEMNDKFHLRVVGTNISCRAYRGNHTLLFGGNQDNPGHLFSDDFIENDITDGYSMEAWVKPNLYHWFVIGLLSDWKEETSDRGAPNMGMMFQCRRNKEIRFLHRDPPPKKGGTYCIADVEYAIRKWQHMVAVKDKNELRIYVDGRLAGAQADPKGLSKGLRFVVGKLLPHSNTTAGICRFIGEMDELAFYDRPLKEEEIVQHYELVFPKEKPITKSTALDGTTKEF